MNSGNEYSLSEFRANLREAFNAAEKGEPVYIERYGVTYCLVSAENWNESQTKAAFTGQSQLVTDGESSNVRPDPVVQLPDGSHAIIISGEKKNSDSQSEQKGGEQ